MVTFSTPQLQQIVKEKLGAHVGQRGVQEITAGCTGRGC